MPDAPQGQASRLAAGDIDASGFDTGITGLLVAGTETGLAEVVRSLPAPIVLTSPDRRIPKPLEIHSGTGRLRLAGKWQVARETHVRADPGGITRLQCLKASRLCWISGGGCVCG